MLPDLDTHRQRLLCKRERRSHTAPVPGQQLLQLPSGTHVNENEYSYGAVDANVRACLRGSRAIFERRLASFTSSHHFEF